MVPHSLFLIDSSLPRAGRAATFKRVEKNLMSATQPKKLHEYTNHPVIDSTRWSAYNHRPGDIIVSTSYKTGTTWMQTIVANLLYQDGEMPAPVTVMAPWLDMSLPPLEEIVQGLEAQTGRRALKTHLPLDGLPYFDTARYIVVGRDIRDVFMSIWNHHSGYTDEIKGYTKERADAVGREFPLDIGDIHELWRMWIEKSWFEWESPATLTGHTCTTCNRGGISVTYPTSCWCTSPIYLRTPRAKSGGSRRISTSRLTSDFYREYSSEFRSGV